MGCCQPVLAPVENFYNRWQIDEMLEEIESAITSGCCITPEEVDEKIEAATSGLQETLVAGDNIIISGNVISAVGGSSGCGCDLSDYVTFDDMPDVYTKQEVNNLFVTKQYFTANTISRDVFITTIYNLNQEINSLKAAISACCGSTGETYTRWITVPNDYECSGTTKYTKEKEQTSTDGINWTDTGNTRRGSTVLEVNSPDCGYIPPVSYKVNMRYYDGTEDNRQCDGSGNLRALNPSDWWEISGVTVGECIDEIGNLCFYGFSGLTEASLPNTVTKLGLKAFAACESLLEVNIPSGVTSLGNFAFEQCHVLSSITIPNGVTEIPYAAFSQCSGLTSVSLPSNLETLGNSAFMLCVGMTSFNIPASITTIDQYAFMACTSLTGITINATTPPTLVNKNAFMTTNDCPIYVPANSVDAYKAAENWSELADRIQAIP